MITKIGSGVRPTFKANVLFVQQGHGNTFTISSADVDSLKKQFKQIGDDKDNFTYTYNVFNDLTSHCFEYYRENNKEKRVRFVLRDDHFLTPRESFKVLIKAIIAKEPITTQTSNKIESIVQFPELPLPKNLKIRYSKQYSQSEDNFYYRNGEKAVCVKNITPDTGIAEYYDKNGSLQFKKYKTRFSTLTEKYNKDGQISYKIISGNPFLTFPIVIKDNKVFQMYAYKVCKPDSEKITSDYRVLIEHNDNKTLRYYLDSTLSGIRPKDAPSDLYYRVNCNKYPKIWNEEYAKELMKKNPLYTPEHLKELYLLPQEFSKEFIEDNTIFKTNYRINLDDDKLKPNTEKFDYKDWCMECYSGGINYNYEEIATTGYGNPRYIEAFEIPKFSGTYPPGSRIDNEWDRNIERLD